MQRDLCEIRIYDPDFEWIGQVKNVESVQLVREFYGCGSFEIHMQADKMHTGALRERGNIIVINGDPNKAGIIRDFYIEESRSGAELVVYGDTADGICRQRITVPPTKAENSAALGWDRIRGPAETVLKHYAQRNVGTKAYAPRRVPRLQIAPDKQRGVEMPWQTRYKPLDEELAAIAEYADIGWGIVADIPGRRWVFEVDEGVERTRNQQERSPVTFQLAYTNIGKYRYTMDYQSYKSTGYAGGAGEDENRLIYTLGAEVGGNARWEVFLECGNADNAEELKYYGNQKMEDHKNAQSILAEVLPNVFVFERDFYLGDRVTVVLDRLSLAMDARVSAVTQSWERGTGYRNDIRFGSKLPNIYKVLKKEEEIR